MEIGITVHREDMDAVSDIFDGLGTGGVVIEDPALIYDVVSGGSEDTVAMDISLVDPEAPPCIKGYLPADDGFGDLLSGLLDALGSINRSYPPEVTLREVEDEDWMNRWRDYYHPFRVGKRLMVKPTWEQADTGEGLLVIEMDPGMAFGCGTHSSTSMCMRLLEDTVRAGEYVIDVGTGSGILAIAAVKLGASAALAVDTDAGAVRTARENVSLNGLEGAITVKEGNLLEGLDTRADIIVANIVADVIIKLLPAAASLLKEGGRFMASGIISGRQEEVAAAIGKTGMNIINTLREGEWVAFLAVKK
ncbi:MAG: 50S ribosomal protein L11 methyltransferase [Actinobacteria bacterium]|nr:50S ribosomal protein L11 methyltransferase [Actinomycetota bacterium]